MTTSGRSFQAIRDRAIEAAASALVDAVMERASRTPREAAEAAWYPGHPLVSVEAIEAEIVRRRELDVLAYAPPTAA